MNKGWRGEGRRHRLAALKGLPAYKKPKEYHQTERGYKLDLARKSKHERKPWQASWRGDAYGSKI